MDLSICIITKNESHKLARLLSSVEKLDCEIVVVDTGSVDDSIETAYRYTDRVFFYKWRDDFADAKNLAAERAGNDVVMILDTDEWITEFGRQQAAELEELVDKLSDGSYGRDHVGRINRINILEKDGERRDNYEWINRIYNRRFFEYEGKIHEQLVRRAGQTIKQTNKTEDKTTDKTTDKTADKIADKTTDKTIDRTVHPDSSPDNTGYYISENNYDMVRSSVKILHDGYLGTPEEKRKKAERNKTLLLKELEETEKFIQTLETSEASLGNRDDLISKKTYILYQLGKSSYMAGDPAEAVVFFDKALVYDLDPKLEYVIDMVETYGYALINSGQEQVALGLEGVLDDFGGNADFCFMMGLVYMKNAQFEKAIFCFDEALGKPQCRMQGVNSYLSHYNKGVIYECLGDVASAAESYGKAGDYEKAKEGLKRLEEKASREKRNILIIYGVTYCYNILNHILENFGKALEKQGFNVEYYDEQAEGVAGIVRYYGRSFDAVIGVQTYLYSVFLKDSGRFLFDGIKAPKYNIVLDHPGWLSGLLSEVPQDTYVLTHDTNYIAFIEKYYPKIGGSFLLPPGGVRNPYIGGGSGDENSGRKYDLVFIGTYGDFRKKCEQIRECNPFAKKLALKYLIMLKKYVNDPAEKVFANTLKELGIEPSSDSEFLNLFAAMNPVFQLVMYYYREKVLRTLAEGGVDIDVWGETWRDAPFMNVSPYKERIHIHDDLTPDEAEKVLAQSRIALNIMAWHKAGFTERLANTMLSKTVMLSDVSTYITEHFKCLSPADILPLDPKTDQVAEKMCNSEIAVFRLDSLQELPQFVKGLLADIKVLTAMAEKGYDRCLKEHTWDARAIQFMTELR